MLHDGIIDRIGGAILERRLVKANEIIVTSRVGKSASTRADDIRPHTLQFVEEQRCREQEHASIPEMLARSDKMLRHIQSRLFDEFGHPKHAGDPIDRGAAPDITITGFGTLRGDAKRRQGAGTGGGLSAVDRCGKSSLVADDVI